MVRLPKPYQMQFLEGNCAAPLILAYMLVAEAKLLMDEDAEKFYGAALGVFESLSEPFKAILAQDGNGWPFREATERFQITANATVGMAMSAPATLGRYGVVSVEVLVAHCREPLDWIGNDLAPIVPPHTSLTVYEKCGETSELQAAAWRRSGFVRVEVRPCPDPAGGPRGDECLAYLSHIVSRYEELASFTVFLQADPDQHLHFDYLKVALAMIARGTYSVPFLTLNGARHSLTLTPCMAAVHQAIFGEPLLQGVGPYCCAQFIVRDARVRERPISFYRRMLGLVDGSAGYDLCTSGKVTRSTHCYGMEFLWHRVFGEPLEPPLRQDDARLPLPLRLKFGVEFTKRRWDDVVLYPNTARKIVEQIDYDQMV